MNAICVYITAARIVMQTDTADTCSTSNSPSKKYNNNNNKDQLQRKLIYLNEALPQLRQLLSCVVCCRLLSDPYSPCESQCQHYVCRLCIRGKKSLKAPCAECADCTDFNAYNENKQMHCLLLCYKGLCQYILSSALYHDLEKQTEEIVVEGANYDDGSQLSLTNNNKKHFISKNKWLATRSSFCKVSTVAAVPPPAIKLENQKLLKSEPLDVEAQKNLFEIAEVDTKKNMTLAHGIPTPLTIASAQLVSLKRQALKTDTANKPVGYKLAMSEIVNNPALSNGAAMYSVLYTGIGNKITIKRKPTNEDVEKTTSETSQHTTNTLDVVKSGCNDSASKRRGCRCGNATPTPGKLTCCGQRCPCYVEAKSCTNCKCRGCRNPHRPGGGKIRPIIPKLSCYEIQINNSGEKIPSAPVVANRNPHQHIYNYNNNNNSNSNNSAIPIEYYEYNCKFPTNEIVIPATTTTQTTLPLYATQTHEFNSQPKDVFYKTNISNMIPQQNSQHEFETNSTQKLSLYLQQQLNKQNIIMQPISSTTTTTTTTSTRSNENTLPLIMTSPAPYLKELVNLKPNTGASNQTTAFTTTDTTNMLVTMLAKNSGINFIMGSSDI